MELYWKLIAKMVGVVCEVVAWSYIGLFLLDLGSRGSKSEIYFEDFKTVLFLHFTLYVRRMW